MEFQDVVRKRKMVRSFEDRPIPRETVERIVANVQRARNDAPWDLARGLFERSFIDVAEANLRAAGGEPLRSCQAYPSSPAGDRDDHRRNTTATPVSRRSAAAPGT